MTIVPKCDRNGRARGREARAFSAGRLPGGGRARRGAGLSAKPAARQAAVRAGGEGGGRGLLRGGVGLRGLEDALARAVRAVGPLPRHSAFQMVSDGPLHLRGEEGAVRRRRVLLCLLCVKVHFFSVHGYEERCAR